MAIAADCKSAPSGFGGSSPPPPTNFMVRGSSSVGRASAFQAEGREFEPRFPLHKSRCSSGVERILGKDEVMSSNPIIGSFFRSEWTFNLGVNT